MYEIEYSDIDLEQNAWQKTPSLDFINTFALYLYLKENDNPLNRFFKLRRSPELPVSIYKTNEDDCSLMLNELKEGFNEIEKFEKGEIDLPTIDQFLDEI